MTCFNQRLVDGWLFRRLGEKDSWESVSVPHSPFVSDLDGLEHWQGLSEYRRSLKVEESAGGCVHRLYFGAAMHSAVVSVDGVELARHSGGYLPFEIDVTAALGDGLEHELRVVLDNLDNENVPPGKRFQELDFCTYGGLYRHVELRSYAALHITDPVAAGVVAGGGVFVRTEQLSDVSAELSVSVHVKHVGMARCGFSLRYELYDEAGVRVVDGRREGLSVEAESAVQIDFGIEVDAPSVWDLNTPHLYQLQISLIDANGTAADASRERFGIRRLAVSRSGGLQLNGKRIRPRGTNRHQDYPRVGYALSDAAQFRDAKRIKESGFDYVRLSHYPQSPAFLDACDELGILVMNCIPGWQFLGGEAFREACYQNARDLVRRDRNHPCVIFWELSLNETAMDDEFMDTLQAIGHAEYPGDQMFVCGWQDRFDVYIHSRQHGQIHSWENGDKALVVAEYGDWEFYASNEGFDQKTGSGLLADWSNSRAFRGAGERRLRQQARNHIVALNDTMSSPAVCDGLWSMFDYPRGYHPTRAACGVMDFHRLPKYSYFFYRSQRSSLETGVNWSGGAMVYIASRWIEDSILDVLVFSNCEEVSLEIGEETMGPVKATRTETNLNLSYPPFVFRIGAFEPGRLKAVGFVGGVEAARHVIATPGDAAKIELQIDDAGVIARIDEEDVLFAHARILDTCGQLCKSSSLEVSFSISGDAEIVGPGCIDAESGVASVVVRRKVGGESFSLAAECAGCEADRRDYWTSGREVEPLPFV